MAAKKAAAKKPAASSADKQEEKAEKAFAEPESTDQQHADNAPLQDQSVADSLKADQAKAEVLDQQRKVQEKQDGELEEVREIHRAQRERGIARAETSGTVFGIRDPDENPNASADAQDGPQVRVFTADRRFHIETDGEVVLDQDALNTLRGHLDAAFQAVS